MSEARVESHLATARSTRALSLGLMEALMILVDIAITITIWMSVFLVVAAIVRGVRNARHPLHSGHSFYVRMTNEGDDFYATQVDSDQPEPFPTWSKARHRAKLMRRHGFETRIVMLRPDEANEAAMRDTSSPATTSFEAERSEGGSVPRYCSQCGSAIETGARFCASCGAALASSSADAAQERSEGRTSSQSDQERGARPAPLSTSDRRSPIKLAQIVFIPVVVLLVLAVGIFAAFPFSTRGISYGRVKCSPAIVSWTAHRDARLDELVKRYEYVQPPTIHLPPIQRQPLPPLTRSNTREWMRIDGDNMRRDRERKAEEDRLNDEQARLATHAAAAAIGVSDDWDPLDADYKSTRMAACAKPAKTRLTHLGVTSALILLAAGLVLLVAWPRRKASV